MNKKRYSTPRYFNGTKQIQVPDKIDDASVKTGTLGSALSYGQMGYEMTGNPLVGVATGLGGAALGYGQMKAQQKESQLAADSAERKNEQYSDLGIGNTQIDPQLNFYQARNGYKYEHGGVTPSKTIEIEKNEIVTDGDYNVKDVGETPHSEGGDKINVNQGDTVFPTQNPKDFKSILEKIKAYKNGSQKAKEELDQVKDQLPTDTDKAQDGLNNPYQVNPYMESVPRGYATGDAGELPNVYGSALSDFASMYKGQGTPEQYNSFLSEKGVSPRGMWQYQRDQGGDVGTAISDNPIGPMSTADANSYYTPPVKSSTTPETITSNEYISPVTMRKAPQYDEFQMAPDLPISQEKSTTKKESDEESMFEYQETNRTNPFKYANVAYNLMKGQEEVDTYDPIKPTYQKFQYEDMSAPARRAALDAQKIAERNIETTGGSRGQIQSYLGQAGARYNKQVQDIQAQEAARKQAIQAQNVQLENRARDMEYQDMLGARKYEQMGRGVQQDFQRKVPLETAQLAQLQEQQEYMRDRNRNQYEMDKLRMRYAGTNNYTYDSQGNLILR